MVQGNHKFDVQLLLKDAAFANSGLYTAKVESINPSTGATTVFTKSFEERKPVRLQIAGFSYIVDFEEMVQYRVDYPTRRRRIKRDVVKKENVKGMAGIYVSEVPSGRGQRPGRTERSDSPAEATDGHRRRDVVDGEESTTETSSSQALSRLVTGFPH